MWYVYVIDKFTYVRIATRNNLKVGKTSDVKKMSHWVNKSDALSWGFKIREKYPTAKLKKAVLTIIN